MPNLARIIELSPQVDEAEDEAYRSYLEELINMDPAEIDRSNAEGIRMAVEGSGLSPEVFAAYLRRWLDDPSITSARIQRWMKGASRPPGGRPLRAIYLMAKPKLNGTLTTHLSRLVTFAVLLPFLQLTDLANQLQ